MIKATLVVLALLSPILPVAGLLVLAEWRGRRRAAVIARQIRLTDAITEELGAVVAPLVSRPVGRPWRVAMQLPVDRPALAGRVLAITHHTLSRIGAARYQFVLTPEAPTRATVTPILHSARPPWWTSYCSEGWRWRRLGSSRSRRYGAPGGGRRPRSYGTASRTPTALMPRRSAPNCAEVG